MFKNYVCPICGATPDSDKGCRRCYSIGLPPYADKQDEILVRLQLLAWKLEPLADRDDPVFQEMHNLQVSHDELFDKNQKANDCIGAIVDFVQMTFCSGCNRPLCAEGSKYDTECPVGKVLSEDVGTEGVEPDPVVESTG